MDMDDAFGGDEDLRSLRDMDPAGGVAAPDSLRAKVKGFADDASEESRAPRTRRRSWALPVAAAGIAVAAFGAGAVVAPGFATPAATAPIVALETPAPDEIAAPVVLGATETADEHGAATEMSASLPWPYPARRHFTSPSFSDEPGHATAYYVDREPPSPDNVAAIAHALGVPDPVAQPDGSWATPGSAGSPGMTLAGSYFSYYDGPGDPVKTCMNESTYEECVANVPKPTEQQARGSMSSLLSAVGIDEDDVQVRVDDSQPGALTVIASRVVDGMATPVVISATVTAQGLSFASGEIGDIVELGTYDVVSPKEAARRLNSSAFAPTQTDGDAVIVPAGAGASGPNSFPPSPDSAIPWGVSEHRIVSARLGLSTVNTVSGDTYVVPAYEFTDSEGHTWSVLALATSALDMTAAPGW